jgi:di/tricarboxylate transporter
VALWILVAIALASSSSGNALTIAIVATLAASLGFMMPVSTYLKSWL